MFVLEKHPYRKTIIVIEDNIQIDCIHYDTIEDLCEILKEYYFFELTNCKTENK